MHNPILLTDSYKLGHTKIYPPHTTNIYSYLESRRGSLFPKTVFFGLQYLLKKYLCQEIHIGMVDEAKSVVRAHLGTDALFNEEGWLHIIHDHKGKLPLVIKAVPEGTSIDINNVLITAENTCPKCFWVTNYFETLLVQVWYPTTVCTLSWHIKQLIKQFLEQTGDPSTIDFKFHDFGFRGASSVESAGIAGCANLVNFKGTDTLEALRVAKEYYHCDMAGFAVPASEHSTITAWQQDREEDAYSNMITQYGDQPIYACVSDSYDIFRACKDYWGTDLKDKVMHAKGTLVIRFDSGDPKEVLLEGIKILSEQFGYTYNAKGYKVLTKVKMLQGDGVDLESIRMILTQFTEAGWSTDNIGFGCGGALVQRINRDTQRFAFKCSSAIVNGQTIDVFKSPITDRSKDSKAGRMSLIQVASKPAKYVTKPDSDRLGDILVPVFKNGEMLQDWTLDQIRKIAEVQ